jgi:RimJ/RimL family protein N-acetyltransferase
MTNFSDIRLETARLELRPLRAGDERRLFEIYSDPEFMRYWSSPPWTTVDPGIALIAKDQKEMAEGLQIRLAIILRVDGGLIGTCTLFKIDKQCRRAELGYGIDRRYWRAGFMFEAVSSLIEFGFSELNLNRIEADIDPRNTASGRSLEKLGFLKEGFLRQRWIVGEEISDSALYGLLVQDWRRNRAAGDA